MEYHREETMSVEFVSEKLRELDELAEASHLRRLPDNIAEIVAPMSAVIVTEMFDGKVSEVSLVWLRLMAAYAGNIYRAGYSAGYNSIQARVRGGDGVSKTI